MATLDQPHKVVLITASSGGLGAEIARSFAPDHRVVINYFSNKQRGDDLAQDLAKVPCTHASPAEPRFLVVGGDVGQRDDLNRMVDETVKSMGRLDIVVSNAGWTKIINFTSFDDNLDEDVWDKCFLYNVKAHLSLMKAAKPHLDAVEGAFVTTSSIAGVVPTGSSLAYSVTKAAQIHLAKGLAVLCAPKIRVNCVAPGLLLTDWGSKFTHERIERYRQSTKLKRIPDLKDVADQIRLLGTNGSMTGQNVIIDGGVVI